MISATELTLAVPITFDLDALSEIRHSDDPPEKQYVVSATKQAIIGAIPNHIDAVKPKPFVREPTFDLHIRGNPINAQRITITVAPSTTLHELMMLLEDETGLSAKKQRLFLSGRLICDGNSDTAKDLPVKHVRHRIVRAGCGGILICAIM